MYRDFKVEFFYFSQFIINTFNFLIEKLILNIINLYIVEPYLTLPTLILNFEVSTYDY